MSTKSKGQVMRQQGCTNGTDGVTHAAKRGFTLIELLVVVAVIALLIGILLPALGSARASAWQSRGASTQRQMLLAIQTYGNTYNFHIPGINTSGIRNEQYQQTPAQGQALNRSGNAPTQQYDWMSPSLDERDLPITRADRLSNIMEQYRDPAMRERGIPDAGDSFDEEDIDRLAQSRDGFASPSYMMPFAWQFARETLTNTDGTTRQWGVPTQLDEGIRLPSGWFPRIDRVGPESSKAALSDGVARPLPEGVQLDGNIWLNPQSPQFFNGGMFVHDTPTRRQSDIFGDTDSNNATQGANLALSYRHGRRMNVGFFDGHVKILDRSQSTDPALWYPTGSIWLGGNWIAQEAQNLGYVVNPGDGEGTNRIN
jgi:prepilin-type N-terminal cleavage/methylation domain-containing protein/prepilin-type processing-associated H-X9-DG protein